LFILAASLLVGVHADFEVQTNDALQQQNQLGVLQFNLASFEKSTLVSFEGQAEFSTRDAETKPPSSAGHPSRVCTEGKPKLKNFSSLAESDVLLT
jgi:hypothetical protein